MHPIVARVRTQMLRLRRRAYAARSWMPWWRERHLLEAMVGPLGYWEELRSYQLSALRENGLQPHHHLLDIGCGPLQGGIAFIGYLEAGRYVGVDTNPENLAAGYRQIGEHHLAAKNPSLLHSERFGADLLGDRRFDFIWASQILYYFDDRVMDTLLRSVADRLAPGGRFLGDIIGERHPEYARAGESAFLSGIQLQSITGIQRIAAPLGLEARGLLELEHYGYPARLSLRTNLLVEFTRST